METDNTFVTIKKSDGQNFYPYILGTFSKNQRAIPFRTYNYQTEKEKVVFKIIEDPQKKIKGIWASLRLSLLSLTLAPFGIWALANGIFFSNGLQLQVLLAILSLFFLHGFVFTLNDYMDHLQGGDRYFVKGGSRVIQRGWLTAWQMRLLSAVFFILSLITGLWTLHQQWPLLLGVIVLVLSLFALRFILKTHLTKWGVGEFLTILFLGPLIVYFADKTFYVQSRLEVYLLSALLGFLSLLALQLKNLECIMERAHIQKSSFINWVGFDKGKIFILIEMALFIICYFLWVWIYKNHIGGWMSFLITWVFLSSYFKRVKKSVSPLSSSMYHLGLKGALFHWIFSLSALVLYGVEWTQ